MWRAWGWLGLALLTPVLLIIVALKKQEAVGRQWASEQKATAIAALRPPASPPNCPAYTSIDGTRVPAGNLADVRIIRFGRTVYYYPTHWIHFKQPSPYNHVGGIDRDALGVLDPDLHLVECPGIVHKVTNGGLYFSRFMGIGVSPEPEFLMNDALRPLRGVTFIYAQKLRHEGDNIREARILDYMGDGFKESFDHKRLDAYAYIAPDLGWRIGWHPRRKSQAEWDRQFEDWYHSSSRPRPWDKESRTAEYGALMAAARKLHAWLMTPPKVRSATP